MTRNPIVIENPSPKCISVMERLKEEKIATLKKMRAMRNNAVTIAVS
ncbi:MAG: hypothetical protein KBT34_06990 [Prevotella sp.]|nr:hypothetical protein [Candidatus Prevotella equi]